MCKASKYHKEGFTCGEAIIKSANEKFETNIPIAIGSSMGGGLAVGSLCGAVCAGASVIGYLKGRRDETEKNEARMPTKQLMEGVKEKFGTNICLELKRNGVSCEKIIDHVDNFLLENISK